VSKGRVDVVKPEFERHIVFFCQLAQQGTLENRRDHQVATLAKGGQVIFYLDISASQVPK
jgi:hypothetical protein